MQLRQRTETHIRFYGFVGKKIYIVVFLVMTACYKVVGGNEVPEEQTTPCLPL